MENSSLDVWRILMVDDDEDDYLIASDMLKQSKGHSISVVWAASYEAGQEFLQANHYHAVLVDYDLGPRSGIQLIRETVESGYPSPLILYTGRGGYEIDIEAMEAGASLYLAKGDANPLILERFIRYAIENKRLKTELDRRTREQLIILESIQDGLIGIDWNWCITYVNPRAAHAYHLEPDELTGVNIWEAYPRMLGSELETQYRRVMADRTPVQFETRGKYKDQWLNIAVYPSAEGISVYWQDITERKRSEAILSTYAQELERSNRDLQEFAFVASHDLQEPLRKVEVFSNLMLETPENLNERQRDLLARLRSSANRMRSMVDGLLEISQVGIDTRPFLPVDLNQIVQDVRADLEMQIRQTQAVLDTCSLPVIDADPIQMLRLFQNLIANAIKFQPNGRKPRVEICMAEDSLPGHVQILIKDNGIGFDDQHAQHLFEPFKRLVTRNEYDGSGIGLAICRKIVERHHGSITARGQAGQGATFIITLPDHQQPELKFKKTQAIGR